MITLGKRGDLHARRQAALLSRNEIASRKHDDSSKYTSTTALQKLFSEIAHLVTQTVTVDTLILSVSVVVTIIRWRHQFC